MSWLLFELDYKRKNEDVIDNNYDEYSDDDGNDNAYDDVCNEMIRMMKGPSPVWSALVLA